MTNKPMEKLLNKMCSVIDTSKKHHKDFVRRYLSLANRKLHSICEDDIYDTFACAGASNQIERRFEEKFGCFICKSTPAKHIGE